MKKKNYHSLKVFTNKQNSKNATDIGLHTKKIDGLYDNDDFISQEVEANTNKARLFSNPNILVNANFQVNQRQKSGYSSNASSHIYTVDRWCFSKMANSTCAITSNKITLKSSGTARIDFFMQYVANPSFYSGKTVTLSVKYQNLTGKFGIGIRDGSVFSKTDWTTASSGTLVLTKTIQSSCTKLSCELLKENTTAISVEILSAKLELGTVATPFVQRTYDEDFQLCKPYFLRLKASSNYSIFATGISYSATKAIFLMPHKMRAAPTLTTSGAIRVLNSTGYLTCSSISQDGYSDAGVVVSCAGTNFAAGQGALLSSFKDSVAYIDLDAEIK